MEGGGIKRRGRINGRGMNYGRGRGLKGDRSSLVIFLKRSLDFILYIYLGINGMSCVAASSEKAQVLSEVKRLTG